MSSAGMDGWSSPGWAVLPVARPLIAVVLKGRISEKETRSAEINVDRSVVRG